MVVKKKCSCSPRRQFWFLCFHQLPVKTALFIYRNSPSEFLAKTVKIHYTSREKPGFSLSSLTFARICRSCDDLCPVSGWKSDSLWSGSECFWSGLLIPDKFKLNWRGMIQQRKRRGVSQLTTLLFLFFVRDSLNVSVKQLRSVGQTQGTSQRLCEEIPPVPDVILNLLLHWREWRWFELPRSWPTILCQYHGHLMSPARIQGSNTHPANSFTLENHYWNSKYKQAKRATCLSVIQGNDISNYLPWVLLLLICLRRHSCNPTDRFRDATQHVDGNMSPLDEAAMWRSSGNSRSRWVRNTSSTESLLSPVNVI